MVHRLLSECPRFVTSELHNEAGQKVVRCSYCVISAKHGHVCRFAEQSPQMKAVLKEDIHSNIAREPDIIVKS